MEVTVDYGTSLTSAMEVTMDYGTSLTSASEAPQETKEDGAERVIEGTMLTVIGLLATIGNFLLYAIVLRNAELRNCSNCLILCLATSDILVSVVNIPVTVYTIFVNTWMFSVTTCTVMGFINMITFIASVMSLSVISINRYIRVCRNDQFQKIYTPRHTALMALGVWLLSVGLATPPLLGWGYYEYLPNQSFCFCNWKKSVSYTFFMIGCCFCGPCLVMSCCYFKIIKSVRDSHRRISTVENKNRTCSPNVRENTRNSRLLGVFNWGRGGRSEAVDISSVPYSENYASALSSQQRISGNGESSFVETDLDTTQNPDTEGNSCARGLQIDCEDIDRQTNPCGSSTEPSQNGGKSGLRTKGRGRLAAVRLAKRKSFLLAEKFNSRSSRQRRFSRMETRRKQEEVKVTLSLLIVIIVFVLCWFPFCVMMFYNVFSDHLVSRPADILGLFLGYSNSCYNPIIYGVMNKRFLHAYRSLFRSLLCCFSADSEKAKPKNKTKQSMDE